jgi:aryl-alcohol dehydrogenase-like predicted oxidoreductase
MVWSPLAGGLLSGKYTREKPAGDGGRLTGFDFLPHDREKGYQVVEKLRAIGAAHGVSPAQIALAWLLAQTHVASVLIGANKRAQLDDNLGAVNVNLTAEEIAELDRLTAPALIYPNWFNKRTADAPVTQALSPEPGAVHSSAGTNA